MANKKVISTWFGIIIIAIAVVILFGGVFAYESLSPKTQNFESLRITSKKITPKNCPNGVIVNTLNGPQCDVSANEVSAIWKTYSGYGISFKYPSSIGEPKIRQLSTKTSISFNNNAIEFDIGSYYDQNLQRNMTIDEVAGSTVIHQNAINIESKEIIIDGKKGIKLDYMDSVSGGGATEIYFPIDGNGNILMIYQYGRATSGMEANISQILPTLKFIK